MYLKYSCFEKYRLEVFVVRILIKRVHKNFIRMYD